MQRLMGDDPEVASTLMRLWVMALLQNENEIHN